MKQQGVHISSSTDKNNEHRNVCVWRATPTCAKAARPYIATLCNLVRRLQLEGCNVPPLLTLTRWNATGPNGQLGAVGGNPWWLVKPERSG